MKSKRIMTACTVVFLSFGLILILIPFYLTIVSAFKSTSELFNNFFGIPETLYLDNFITVLSNNSYYYALKNSFIITICSLACCAMLLPMAAYAISRRMHSSKFYKFLYFFMISGLFVPFMVRMIPVIKLLNEWDLSNKLGLVLIYVGGATCEGIFLMTGYLSTIPTDLEEAAYIDGASTVRVFFNIVFPLMRPIVATVLIKNALWYWNDYLLPSLLLRTASEQTLILFQYNFQGAYATQYPLVFACFVLSILPIMLFYLIMQKHIIGGMMNGAVKG